VSDDVYVVAGRDLQPFVERWIDEIERGDLVAYPFVATLRDATTSEADRAFAGEALARQFIAPRVWGDAGSDEELLLFAVICSYPLSGQPPWQGMRDFVRRAFVRFQEVGPTAIAHDLREDVLTLSGSPADDPALAWLHEVRRQSMRGDPARMAAHDQAMARGGQRALRAARLLDPEGEEAFWAEFLGGGHPEPAS
jgi:hypothetical protein